MTYKTLQFSLGKKINLGLPAGLVVLLVAGLLSYHNLHTLSAMLDERKANYQNRIAVGDWLTSLAAAQADERGFLLTTDEAYVHSYSSAVVSQHAAFWALNTFGQSEAFRAEITANDTLSGKALDDLGRAIQLRRGQSLAAVQAALAKDPGSSGMSQVSANLLAIAGQQDQAAIRSSIQAAKIETQTRYIIVTGTTIAILTMAVAIFVVNRDLAGRRAVQNALLRSEAQSKAIIENLAEGLIVVAPSGNFEIVNKAASSMLGNDTTVTSLELWLTMYTAYLPDKVTPYAPSQLPGVRGLQGERIVDEEMYVMQTATRTGKSLSISATPILAADGTLANCILVFTDITARKQAEDKAAAEKAKAEAILGSIGDGVMALDHSGKVILFNHAAEVICGTSVEQALGCPYRDVVTFYNEKDNTPADGFIRTALSGNNAEAPPYTSLRSKNGTTVPVADSAAPILSSRGIVDGAVVVFRDITTERQLGSMKDDFLSIASHELRTPMGAVRANLAMILAGDYGPVNRGLVEPLSDMKASTVRLVGLVNDLLNVSRMEAGRMTYRLTDLNLYALLDGAVSDLVALGKEKDIAITLVPNDVGLVQADTDKIQEVLNNLVGNAIKFTDEGSITISLAVAGDSVEVLVSDTGMGITPSNQQTLFDKFTQITSAQIGRPIGTGLGLYIAREAIRKMGGDLWIKRSMPGQGSTFAFTLPRAQTKAAALVRQELIRESASGVTAEPH